MLHYGRPILKERYRLAGRAAVVCSRLTGVFAKSRSGFSFVASLIHTTNITNMHLIVHITKPCYQTVTKPCYQTVLPNRVTKPPKSGGFVPGHRSNQHNQDEETK